MNRVIKKNYLNKNLETTQKLNTAALIKFMFVKGLKRSVGSHNAALTNSSKATLEHQ